MGGTGTSAWEERWADLGKDNGYFLGRGRRRSPLAGLSRWIRFGGQVRGSVKR